MSFGFVYESLGSPSFGFVYERLGSPLHQQDLSEGFGEVYLPYAIAKKYPKAPRSPA